ncbi:MAG TPA: MmcB family DNA repair protein [Hyphomicrobiaceae bacterium]|nr:MmcB family DNA repair protein [Hyphomicrobiaceae bacterium]
MSEGPPPLESLDGRQSAAAMEIRRGAQRLLRAHGLASLPEVTLASGRRADLLALAPDGRIAIVEIKSSVADFRADHKWPDYQAFADQLYFAVGPAFPQALIPESAGLIVADRYGGEVVREAPTCKLAPARRKAVTLLLARIAASRLHAGADPEAFQGEIADG